MTDEQWHDRYISLWPGWPLSNMWAMSDSGNEVIWWERVWCGNTMQLSHFPAHRLHYRVVTKYWSRLSFVVGQCKQLILPSLSKESVKSHSKLPGEDCEVDASSQLCSLCHWNVKALIFLSDFVLGVDYYSFSQDRLFQSNSRISSSSCG